MEKKLVYKGFILLLTTTLLAACSSEVVPSKKDTPEKTEQTTQQSSEVKEAGYKIGDTIVFDGYAEFTILTAEWTEERNQFEADFLETVPDKVLKITYNVKNLSEKDYYVGSDLELYVDGKKMESYPNTNTMDTVSAGRGYEGAVQHFGVIGEGDLEIEVKPSMAFDVKAAVVPIQVP